ncbi:hypothetical protein CROQUDRAFT_658718 [Cronartium quercuum f. sp. fusiforme G11]|uniref:Zn(2)-C6 fungal-type domain-containing protein n=1 Tax=Cronartium quercuum f. sp. fusiforme G11 TaxID=708437 RepID=A0A9P6NG41_9BASI|nr:hypothetical protein CROQUDRAFT_658718 [Cronartium quercuum f. sp. fusiforme G11]
MSSISFINPQIKSNQIQPRSVVHRRRTRTKCDRCRIKNLRCEPQIPCKQCNSSDSSCTYNSHQDSNLMKMIQQDNLIKITETKNSIYSKLDELQKIIKSKYLNHQNLNQIKIIWPKIDLEIDNLPNLFSKLWLKPNPDNLFFNSNHSLIVKVRKEALVNWQNSEEWKLWPNNRLTQVETEMPNFFNLPNKFECQKLIELFLLNVNWYFNLYTPNEILISLSNLEWDLETKLIILPNNNSDWLNFSIVVSICRISLALNSNYLVIEKNRKEILDSFFDLALFSLKLSGFEKLPTINGMKVILTLLSTLFFETDCGVLACSIKMSKLRRIALRCAFEMGLNREIVTSDLEEQDARRRVWWGLVTVDAHFGSTGAAEGVISLIESDVNFPKTITQEIDLRSPISRFIMGKFNNRCCYLLSRKRPLANISEIEEFDRDLMNMEFNVLSNQRINFKGPSILNLTDLAAFRDSLDQDLWRGQQIFYLALWHIRSKIHRGLLFTAQTLDPMVMDRINLPVHREIVKDSSILLLELYQYLQLPTAFISAIVGAAITLCMQLKETPDDPEFNKIVGKIRVVLNRLQSICSPIIVRSRRVLEYMISIVEKEVDQPQDQNSREGHSCIPEGLSQSTELGRVELPYDLYPTFRTNFDSKNSLGLNHESQVSTEIDKQWSFEKPECSTSTQRTIDNNALEPISKSLEPLAMTQGIDNNMDLSKLLGYGINQSSSNPSEFIGSQSTFVNSSSSKLPTYFNPTPDLIHHSYVPEQTLTNDLNQFTHDSFESLPIPSNTLSSNDSINLISTFDPGTNNKIDESLNQTLFTDPFKESYFKEDNTIKNCDEIDHQTFLFNNESITGFTNESDDILGIINNNNHNNDLGNLDWDNNDERMKRFESPKAWWEGL